MGDEPCIIEEAKEALDEHEKKVDEQKDAVKKITGEKNDTVQVSQ